MSFHHAARLRALARRLGCGTVASVCLLALAPAGARAAFVEFGSALRAHAALTTDDLDFPGINTQVGTTIVHTAHFGADTALWNVTVAHGSAAAPARGEVAQVELEGCAQPARGGPPPLTQIHFQELVPRGGGATQVALTSQSFSLPVCRQYGVGAATVSSYRPTGLCIGKGDYVGFNDEGGFVEGFYRAGVPYRVIASTRGARMDAYLMGGGTGNGSIFSPSVRAVADGFVANPHEELLLRATLATGRDVGPACARR